MPQSIASRIATLEQKISERIRFSNRRDQLLESIDFDALPLACVHEVSMMDDHLDEQLNDLHLEIFHLEAVQADELASHSLEQFPGGA